METEISCQICDEMLTDGICPEHSHLGKQLKQDEDEDEPDQEFEGLE